ncbi:hypothetical protein [Mucilaginibacter sp. UR6-11]|uniref:hypothetical protein n=1 Tax=Mucilaginibacter sp. UR6-11 TaxID=1435644 RepID=UPI001E36921B|nr:hypothetical protein [Mucilaginibacter sp. UR6-11]MCC8425979.1 hypothetical protein [Mucilaginibacter sp. UR6-11]
MKVLITSALSATAHRLKSKLNIDNVILGDYNDLPAFMLSSGKMIKLPDPCSFSYTHEMLALCLDNLIDLVYVVDSGEIKLLLESKQLFAEYNIDIKVADDEI